MVAAFSAKLKASFTTSQDPLLSPLPPSPPPPPPEAQSHRPRRTVPAAAVNAGAATSPAALFATIISESPTLPSPRSRRSIPRRRGPAPPGRPSGAGRRGQAGTGLERLGPR